MLTSLEGVSTGLRMLTIESAPQLECLNGIEHLQGLQSLKLGYCEQLRHLSGIEGLTALQELRINQCGVTSLQPVGQLVGGLMRLCVNSCHSVEDEVLQLPHILPWAGVYIEGSNVKEVVLAGGLRLRSASASITDDDEMLLPQLLVRLVCGWVVLLPLLVVVVCGWLMLLPLVVVCGWVRLMLRVVLRMRQKLEGLIASEGEPRGVVGQVAGLLADAHDPGESGKDVCGMGWAAWM